MKVVAFGNDLLDRQPRLEAGDLVPCTRCGGEHVAVESRATEPTGRTPLVELRRLPRDPNGHLVLPPRAGTNPDRDDATTYHQPCSPCREARSVPSCDDLNGFPNCCPQQYQGDWYVCTACGYRAHENGCYNLEVKPPSPGGRHHRSAERGVYFCGPMVLDKECRGYWQHYGAEARRPTVLLFYRCGEDSFLVGVNGAVACRHLSRRASQCRRGVRRCRDARPSLQLRGPTMISDRTRNYSPAQKRATLDRLYEEWLRRPNLRLGQLVYTLTVGRHPQTSTVRLPTNPGRDQPTTVGDLVFTVEDHDLLTARVPEASETDKETR